MINNYKTQLILISIYKTAMNLNHKFFMTVSKFCRLQVLNSLEIIEVNPMFLYHYGF